LPKAHVAAKTEQAPNFTREVVVVDVPRAVSAWLIGATDCTTIILGGAYRFVVEIG